VPVLQPAVQQLLLDAQALLDAEALAAELRHGAASHGALASADLGGAAAVVVRLAFARLPGAFAVTLTAGPP
jgi:hypothetical protein